MKRYRFLLLISFLSLLMFSGCTQKHSDKKPPKAVKGVLDLRGWDFDQDGVVKLDGDWEFYWKELINPVQHNNLTNTNHKYFIKLPNHWNDYKHDGHGLSGDGYASFRLVVLVDKPIQRLAFKLREFFSAYQIFANGKLVTGVGVVGKTPMASIPANMPQVADFKMTSTQLDIVLYVSNFNFHRGGPIRDITLGPERQVRKIARNRLLMEIFLFGSIAMMGLYHLSLYLIRKNDQSPLIFSIFCIIISLRLLLTGETFFLEYVPEIKFELMVRLIHLAFYLAIPIFFMFIHSLFPREFSKKILNLFLFFVFLVFLVVVFFPAAIHSHLMRPFQLVTLVVFIYSIVIVGIAIKRKREGAAIFIASILVLFAFLINDILFNNNIIQTGYFGPFGTFIFVFSQAFLLAKKYSRAFTIVEIQKSELSLTNQAYEDEIIEREKAELKFRQIFENSTDGIFQLSPEGRIITANPATAKILGYSSPIEITSQIVDINKNFFIEAKTQTEFFERINSEPSIEAFECSVQKKDGTIVNVLLNVRMIKDKDGTVQYFDGNIEDNTMKKKARELKIERDVAKAANSAKSEFLANMSHEIRTPMNAILGFAEIIDRQIEDRSLKQHLAAIISGGKTLLRIINDVLDFSKIEAGKIEIQPSVVDIKNTFVEIKQIFKFKIEEKGLNFEIYLDPVLPKAILFDEIRIKQILFNLIGNAVKFSEEGTIRLSAYIKNPTLDSSKINLTIVAEDQGIGVPEDQVKNIFDAFVQQKEQNISKYGGTGLGLAITKKIVETMGGHISVDSQLGEGTRFKVYFPDIPIVTKSRFNENEPAFNAETIVLANALILVADDVKENRELIKGYLDGQSNISLSEASNGKEVLSTIEKDLPDIILMDMKMPELSGYEATKIIKNTTEFKSIPIVAVSASALLDDEQEYKTLGCDGFIRKPLTRNDLFKQLVRYIPFQQLDFPKEPSQIAPGELDPTPNHTDIKSDLESLNSLYQLLNSNVEENWLILKERMIIDEIVEFSKEMIEIGNHFQWKKLSDWGQSLKSLSDSFDIGNLMNQLDIFPLLLVDLSRLIEKVK